MRVSQDTGTSGFTLTELLIVVFIIGLMSTLVLVSLPTLSSPLEQEATRLQRALQQASRQAIVRGEPIGWSLTANGASRFEANQLGEWAPLGTAHRTDTDDDLRIFVERADGALMLETANAPPPGALSGRIEHFGREVIFYPAGEATPVRIRLQDGLDEIILTVGPTGSVEREAGS